jgi:DNA-binding protein H-NS
MANLDELTPDELQKLILEAQSKLEAKQHSMRKEVIAQIKALAASIGVSVEIIDGKSKKPSAVSSKYRNPQNPLQEWTGRGLAPRWLKEFIAAGHSKEEFLIND